MAVPKIRFPGFTEDWEQRKLDKIANRYDNLRIPVTASDRISGTTPYYGANGIQDYVKGFTHDGEFVLIAEDGANDLHNYPVQYVNGKVWVNNHAHVLQGINGLVDTRFLGYAFSQVNMEAILVGGSRAKLNASDLMKIEIRLPRLMQEQQHIATFLHSLDQTITLHQRKLEGMKLLKKSLLQKMFPKSGENVPEVRFPGFTDAWEQRKLSELYETACSGGTPSASNGSYYKGNIPFLGISDIKNRYITETAKHITKEALDHSAAKIVPSGSIALAMYASVGKAGILSEDMATSQAFFNMTFCKADTRDFVFTRLERADINHEWEPLISTGTQRNLNALKLKNFEILVPSISEQQKIGELFKFLDQTITLHQRKVEALQKLKKALLQQMFV